MTQSLRFNTSQQQAYNLIQKAKSGDNSAINELCSGIYDATAGQLGTDKDYLDEVLSSADSKTLALIMDNYSEVTGSEIYKDIEDELLYNDKDDVIDRLDAAYKEANGVEYTGDDDGKLTIAQTAKSIGKGVLNKLPSIGLLAVGTYFAPAIAGAVGAGLTTLVGGATAATIVTIGAPVLAAAGVATAGYMIYKGVTDTKEAIDMAKNSKSDQITQEAVTQGTEAVIDTAQGVYIGAQSAKGLYDSVKNLKATTTQASDTAIETKTDEEVLQYINELENDPEVSELTYEHIASMDYFDLTDFEIEKPQLLHDIVRDNKTVVRKVQLLNRTTGEYEEAFVLKNGRNPNVYSISTSKECLGTMTLHDGNNLTSVVDVDPSVLVKASSEYQAGNFTEIYQLETKNIGQNASSYRGIGTELVKQAVMESYKTGHSGRVSLIAGNYLHEGAEAEGFYSHIGMKVAGSRGTSLFAFPENKIVEFLFK